MGTTKVFLTHRHSVLRVAYRYVSGRPLDGVRRTDALFTRGATRALTVDGHASRWASKSGAYRAAWRIGTPITLATTAIAYAYEPLLTEVSTGTIALTGGAIVTRKTVRAFKTRLHTAKYLRPLAGTLARQFGVPDTTPIHQIVSVPEQFRNPNYEIDNTLRSDEVADGTIRVYLPKFHVDSMAVRAEILRTVTGRLGLNADDVDQKWQFVGDAPEAQFRVAPRPPNKVVLKDVAEAMLSAKESAPILGIGRRGKFISVDLDSESPHILISASTGAGKSVQTRAIATQLMRNGAQGTILDLKRQSHRWAKDLPGITYCRDIGPIHDQIIAIAAEGMRRNKLADDIPDDVDTEQLAKLLGPRLFVVLEEINATINKLQDYWAEIREKSDPKSSPAVKALGEILFMGRAVRINVIAIGQLLTARALGGPEARECFTTRILSRFSVNAAKMLIPEIMPPPKSSRHPGRVQVCIGGVAHETQVTLFSDKEAREWATSGTITVPSTWENSNEPVAVIEVEPTYTLAEASRQEWCHPGYEALKKARQRSKTWPSGKMVNGREQWTREQILSAIQLRAAPDTDAA